MDIFGQSWRSFDLLASVELYVWLMGSGRVFPHGSLSTHCTHRDWIMFAKQFRNAKSTLSPLPCLPMHRARDSACRLVDVEIWCLCQDCVRGCSTPFFFGGEEEHSQPLSSMASRAPSVVTHFYRTVYR